jgi:hypothetical protein
VSLNLTRRHRNASQKAFVALEIEKVEAGRAKERRGGDRKSEEYQGGKNATLIERGKAREKAAKAVGAGERYVQDAKKIAKEAPDKAAAIVAGKKTITEAKREMKAAEAENRRAENRAKVALVPKAEQVAEKLGAKFSTIVIDPPWSHDDEADKNQFGRTRPKYKTLIIDEFSRRYATLNIEVLGGFNGLVPIDFDTDDAAILGACAKALPRPNVAKMGRRGFVAFYRAAGELPRARKWLTPKRGGKPGKVLVEILTSTKTVLPPSMHPDTREPYRWLTKGTLYSKPVGNLVPITAEHIAALEVVLRPWCPLPPAPKYRPIQPGEIVADARMRAYALATLRNEAKRLAGMSADSGRILRLFGSGCVLGKFVHHKVLAFAEVEAALLAACRANGVLREDGERQCRDSLASGIKKASGDGLPALQYWGRSTR